MKHANKSLGFSVTIVSNALTGGGAEISMYALHKAFLSQGLHCKLIALNESDASLLGPNIICLNRPWKSGLFSTINNFLQFRNVIKRFESDILILNCELPELFGSLTRFKGKIICVEHTTKPWIGKRSLGRIVRTMLQLKKSVWVSVIKDQEEVWFGGPVIRYIPNPFVLPDSHHKEQVSKALLSYVGGLKVNKRPEWVIKAGIELGLSVNIFGEGLLRKQLEDKYRNYSNQVKFYGFYSNPWGLISRNSLVIVPSQYEGDGMVVMEAILTGIPLVLADNEDMRRFNLDNKHYFNSYEQLIAIIEKNIKSEFKDLLVSNRICNILIHERSLKNVADRWVNVLATLTLNVPTI
jgi:glycosyltransferase involved in cell wall biosynthesis